MERNASGNGTHAGSGTTATAPGVEDAAPPSASALGSSGASWSSFADFDSSAYLYASAEESTQVAPGLEPVAAESVPITAAAASAPESAASAPESAASAPESAASDVLEDESHLEFSDDFERAEAEYEAALDDALPGGSDAAVEFEGPVEFEGSVEGEELSEAVEEGDDAVHVAWALEQGRDGTMDVAQGDGTTASSGVAEAAEAAPLIEQIENIPDKMAFKIGEAAEMIGVKQYVLRYWESEFDQLRPKKSKNGQRVYSRRDVETGLMIKKLLYVDRFSIEGARAALKQLKKEVRGERDLRAVGAAHDAALRGLRSLIVRIDRARERLSQAL